MKKLTIFIVMLFFTSLSSNVLVAQGNGFIKAFHSNNIDTEKRDQKTFAWDVMGRFPIKNNLFVFGYINGNDSLYNTLAGISFKPTDNFRFEIGGGAEFLEIPEKISRQINPAFIFRMYAGDNNQKNNLWVNIISGTRFWWQGIYIHQFNKWLGAGLTAEDKKGGGVRVELYPFLSCKEGIVIFSNAFYNGENKSKKIGFDFVVDVGISLIF